MKFMLNCKEASQIISQSLDKPLLWSDRMKLKFHLLICDACTRFIQQMRLLTTAIKQLRHETENDSSIQLSLDAKARINSEIESKTH
jgi:hypothetical protein